MIAEENIKLKMDISSVIHKKCVIYFMKRFSSDLMSDALALLKNETEEVLFITGLANVQSLRTAEVLDIDTILFVRGKPLDMTIVDMAKNLHINLFQTDETMFEACGKLYEAGMRR